MNSALVLISLLATCNAAWHTPFSARVVTSPVATVTLGGCQNVAVQAGTAITFGGTLTTISSGDIAVSPGVSITGSYKLVAGTAHINDAYATQCAADLKTAYSQAATAKCTNLIASDLGSLTLTPGVYCTPSGKFIISAGVLTLDAQGNPLAEWIFQSASTLVTAGATSVQLVNNARASNVFWAVGSSATLGSSSSLMGTILSQVSITFGSGSNIVGRGLAVAAVSFASGSSSDQGQQSIGLPAVSAPATRTKKLRAVPLPTPATSVQLGSCKKFALQAQTDLTFDGTTTTITSGDIGVSPGTSITGSYKLVTGTAHINDADAKQCTGDMTTAYSQAAALKCTTLPEDLSNITVYPGVYCSPSGKFIISTGTLTLDAVGNPYSEFIFQTTSTFITASSTVVKLQNNADANNVYWAIGSSMTLGGSSTMVGNILSKVSITFNSGTNINGRGLAQAACTFASKTTQSQDGPATVIGIPALPAIPAAHAASS